MRSFPPISLLCWILLLLALEVVHATEAHTNHDWVSFGVSISKTNFFAGDKVPASMVVSNVSETVHYLRPVHGDQCGPGFGEFQISEMTSGKTIECKFSAEQRLPYSAALDTLEGHRVESFEINLAYGYGLTNSGIYTVQAMGKFSTNDPPTASNFFSITTPPVIIYLSPKADTNAPSK